MLSFDPSLGFSVCFSYVSPPPIVGICICMIHGKLCVIKETIFNLKSCLINILTMYHTNA